MSSISPAPDAPPTSSRTAVSALPSWPIERLIAALGRYPAVLGRGLDRLAKSPFPIGTTVRFFSSVWLGILWLFLTGVYIGIGSGMAQIRARLEMTDLQFFDAPPMVTLMLLLAITLTTVTLRRIPLTLYKLGVWTVHIGIITLLTGCFIYFSLKREGSVRLFLNRPANAYYDATERALYLSRQAPGAPQIMIPQPNLPIYYEHFADQGNPLDLPIPAATLSTDPQLNNLRIRVTGYYPDAELQDLWTAPPTPPAPLPPSSEFAASTATPGIEIALNLANEIASSRWLVAASPADRLFDPDGGPMGIEYLYHPTPEQLRDITSTFTADAAITVRIPKLGIDRLYPVEVGKSIVVEGSSYTLTPGDTSVMPLRSKGYEGTSSSILMVDVVRKDAGDFKFQRQAVSRYPERSPDFVIENGQPKRIQDRVDNDLTIIFHDATRNQIWIVENEQGRLTVVQREVGGKVATHPVQIAQPLAISLGKFELSLIVAQKTSHAVKIQMPLIIPPRQRERSTSVMEVISNSVLELQIARGDFRQRVYVPFVQFATTQGLPYGRPPAVVDVPGIGPLQLVFSTVRRELPATLRLVDFTPVKLKGTTRVFQDYISTFQVTDQQSGQTTDMIAQLNRPAADHGLYYFQSAWDGDELAPADKRFSVLGVGNRPGIGVMTLGSILIFVGIGYAFYIKPILLNLRKKQLATFTAQSQALSNLRHNV